MMNEVSDVQERKHTFSPSVVSRPPHPVYILWRVGVVRWDVKMVRCSVHSQSIPFVLVILILSRHDHAVASFTLAIDALHNSAMNTSMVKIEPGSLSDEY